MMMMMIIVIADDTSFVRKHVPIIYLDLMTIMNKNIKTVLVLFVSFVFDTIHDVLMQCPLVDSSH